MIVIHVALNIKPENKETLLNFAKYEVAEARKFDGCNTFTVYADTQVDNRYVLYEQWETIEAFEAYKASDLFKKSGEVLFPIIDGKPESSYFDAKEFQQA